MEPEVLKCYNSSQEEVLRLICKDRWDCWNKEKHYTPTETKILFADRNGYYLKHQASCKSHGWSSNRQIPCLVFTHISIEHVYVGRGL